MIDSASEATMRCSPELENGPSEVVVSRGLAVPFTLCIAALLMVATGGGVSSTARSRRGREGRDRRTRIIARRSNSLYLGYELLETGELEVPARHRHGKSCAE